MHSDFIGLPLSKDSAQHMGPPTTPGPRPSHQVDPVLAPNKHCLSCKSNHYKFLLTRVYDHAGCKEHCKDFTVALKMFDVCNKKQMASLSNTVKVSAYKKVFVSIVTYVHEP